MFSLLAGCTGSCERTFKRIRRESKKAQWKIFCEICFFTLISVFTREKHQVESNRRRNYSDHENNLLSCADRFVRPIIVVANPLTHIVISLSFSYLLAVLLIQSVFCDKPSTCGQTACPHYTRPVCATNGRIRRTFNNQCAVRTFNECSSDESE